MILPHFSKPLGVMLCSLTLSSLPLQAAAPVFNAIFPAGGKLGETVKVDLTGIFPPDTTLWSSIAGLSFKKGPGKSDWWITIPENAPIGPASLYAKNKEGVSVHRWFSVGRLEEVLEVEPNQSLAQSQPITSLPICINGHYRVANDVDLYKIELKKGQTLYGYIEAYSLGSLIDPQVQILDSKGVRLATYTEGVNLDPIVEFTAPTDGTYYLEFTCFAHPPEANVSFRSNANSSYRLHLHLGPLATKLTLPVYLTNAAHPSKFEGLGLNANQSQTQVDPKFLHPIGSRTTALLSDAIYPILVTPVNKVLGQEVEPNDQQDQATRLNEHGAVVGTLKSGSDRDLYVYAGTKGERLRISAISQAIGQSNDLSLRVYATPDKPLANIDDVYQLPDPVSILTLPATGDYFIEVFSHFPAPDSRNQYVLELQSYVPRAKASIATSTPLVLQPGKSVEVSVNLRLDSGYKGDIKLVAANLPPGVTAEPVKISPAKGGSHKLTLSAAANATWQQNQIRIEAWDAENQVLPVYSLLRGEDHRGLSLLDEIDYIWLTVTGAATK